jgi:predicted deacylase
VTDAATQSEAGGPIAGDRFLGAFEQGQGPTLVVIGGVHGNEPAGIHAARRVLDRLRSERPELFRGRFVALAGNLPALAGPPGTRYVDRDLNRSFTEKLLSTADPGCAECVQARQLLKAVGAEARPGAALFVMDLHTTSAPSPPVVVLEDALRARRFARSLEIPMLLGFEEEVDGLLYDHLTQKLGCVSCVVEAGQHDDPRSVEIHEAAIRAGLHASGVWPLSPGEADPRPLLRAASGSRARRVYDLRHREPITDPSFRMEDAVHAHTPVRRGQAVGVQGGCPVRTPVGGQVFLPNRQPVKRPGDDAFFIVREVSLGWLGLSARLRKAPWVRSLAAALPGVHRTPSRPEELLVDARIAAVLKRQVFHLLGYRLIRHGREDPRSAGRRLWAVLGGFAGALLSRDSPTGPDDPRFWIVARRTLDRLDDRVGGREDGP